MKTVCIGSLNIDYVYQVEHIVQPGETVSALSLERFPGGKGMNQANALAKAGAVVYMAGMIGEDGLFLLDVCRENGVDTSLVRQSDVRTGNAIIQVAKTGNNSIVLFPGANHAVTADYIEGVLSGFDEGDCIILQNETSCLKECIALAHSRGMKVVLNPSPFRDELLQCPLEMVDLLILNEVEGAQLCGTSDQSIMIDQLCTRFPHAEIVLTLGESGAVYGCGTTRVYQPAFRVHAVDTTAAGDTFTGFFLAQYLEGKSITECLKTAAKAAAIAVTRKGAIPSIPTIFQVKQLSKQEF